MPRTSNKNKPLYRQTEKIIENVYSLIEIKGVRVSDVEKAICVCSGYLSRVKKGMHIDAITLINLANFFNVTIDSLVYSDYKNMLIQSKLASLEEDYRREKYKLEKECEDRQREVLNALKVTK